MYELLKTPGKKKDAPKRTRAATAAVAKLKAMNSMVFEVCYIQLLFHLMFRHDQVRFTRTWGLPRSPKRMGNQ